MPHVKSREPCGFTTVPDDPQTFTLNILQLQKKRSPDAYSEWDQGLTFTKNVSRGFLFYSTPPTQVFLNRRAAAQYRALASIIPGRENF